MWNKPLDDLDQADFSELVTNQSPETVRLDFKRELPLSSPTEKKEVAKDVSAMANTAGGRIVYGIDEISLPNGGRVASAVVPLSDGTLASRLEDVVVTTIQPRPRFRVRSVPVTGGYVLVVEVYPSMGHDLYMVSGYKDYRFYRRAEEKTIVMTEPEIREAYVRIADSRASLQQVIASAVKAEQQHSLTRFDEFMFVIPVFGHPHLVPQSLLGSRPHIPLGNGPMHHDVWWATTSPEMSIVSDGCRGARDEGYAAILRSGVIQLAQKNMDQRNDRTWFSTLRSTQMIVSALRLANYLLNRVAYWGPVRVVHNVKASTDFFVYDERGEKFACLVQEQVAAGHYAHELPDAYLLESPLQLATLAADLLHRIFQMCGEPECRWFGQNGRLNGNMVGFLGDETAVFFQQP